jgi:hypothetical protein
LITAKQSKALPIANCRFLIFQIGNWQSELAIGSKSYGYKKVNTHIGSATLSNVSDA